MKQKPINTKLKELEGCLKVAKLIGNTDMIEHAREQVSIERVQIKEFCTEENEKPVETLQKIHLYTPGYTSVSPTFASEATPEQKENQNIIEIRNKARHSYNEGRFVNHMLDSLTADRKEQRFSAHLADEGTDRRLVQRRV